MILIGENIHVISKSVREALTNRDENFISELLKIQSNMDYADLNVGPAKGNLQGILPWLVQLVESKSDLNISFDTSNFEEMKSGVEVCKRKMFLNSTSSDEPKLSNMIDLALENDCNLVALTLSKETGIPKTSDGRLEIAFNIYEKCLEKGFDSEKIFFDPLILPVCVDQSQGVEALNTIKMIKESFDPPVKTVVGLSNISNGCPKEIRPLINRVYACLACGAGLDAAIIDAKDVELVRILKMIDSNKPQNEVDKLYISLADMIRNFGELEDVDFDESSKEQTEIIKVAKILLDKEIYSHSFTQI